MPRPGRPVLSPAIQVGEVLRIPRIEVLESSVLSIVRPRIAGTEELATHHLECTMNFPVPASSYPASASCSGQEPTAERSLTRSTVSCLPRRPAYAPYASVACRTNNVFVRTGYLPGPRASDCALAPLISRARAGPEFQDGEYNKFSGTVVICNTVVAGLPELACLFSSPSPR